MEIFVWLGTLLMIMCAIPQAYKCYINKNALGLSVSYVYMLQLGLMCHLIYSIYINNTALVINFLVSSLITAVITYYVTKDLLKTN